MTPVAAYGLAAGGLAAMLVAVVASARSVRRRWTALAAALGTELRTSGENPQLVLDATVSGIPVRGEYRLEQTYSTPQGGINLGWRIFSAPYPASAPRYSLQAASLGAGGRRGVQLGTWRAFDKLFVVEGEDEAAIRRIWTLDRQRALREAVGRAAHGSLVAGDGRVVFKSARCRTVGEMKRAVELVAELARSGAKSRP